VARTYQPLGNNVLVQQTTQQEQVTRGGLIVPDSAKERSQEGKVIAVGPGKVLEDGKRQPLEVKVGDLVLFTEYMGTKIKGNVGSDEDFLLLPEDAIKAIIRERTTKSTSANKGSASTSSNKK